MVNILRALCLIATLAITGSAHAAVRILATTADWGALASELGGDKVDVYTATNALQDVHRVDAKPSLVARARNANLVVANGAELEVGWLPVLLQESGNPKVQPGTPGYFEATAQLRLIEVPSAVDRAMGDIHPQGNPHVQLDPRNIAVVAKALTARLAALDPANAGYYEGRDSEFQARWQAAIVRWEAEAAPLKGVPVVVMHKDQSYLCRWLGLKQLAAIEPKPGVPPSAGYLAQLVTTLGSTPPRMIMRNAYNDPKAANWLSERVHAPVVTMPFSVGGTPGARDLYGLFDDSIKQLLAVLEVSDVAVTTNFAVDLSILWPALVAGLLVVLSHVPLGQQVLKRGIVFIDLAIAQVAALGVIAAHTFGHELAGWATQLAAVTAALAGSLLLTWTERKRPEVQEALIGILFVLASTAQILLLANNPHGGEYLKDLLAGQILWVGSDQLIRAAVLTIVFLAVWFQWRERLGRIGFYVIFAVMVTMSVQLVGVYLVFTTLIVPAVATHRHANRAQLAIGLALGLASYVVGLAVSVVTDLPSSAVIVWCMALLAIAVHLTARGGTVQAGSTSS